MVKPLSAMDWPQEILDLQKFHKYYKNKHITNAKLYKFQ